MWDAEAPLALLVENDRPTQQMYAKWFAGSGFRTAVAGTVDEALEKTLILRPHVIATVIRLSGRRLDGCELCQRLKSDERTRTIPVVAVAARTMSAQLARAREAGCDSVLVKPCRADDLLGEIRRLLKLVAPEPRQTIEPAAVASLAAVDEEPWALTTGDGEIVQASDAIGPLLNVGPRHLVGRNIFLFFDGHRLTLRAAVDRSTEEFGVDEHMWIRPRERRPFSVHVSVERRDDPGLLFWVLSRKKK